MQRTLMRAVRLAMSLLLLAAFPVAAQSDGWRFTSEDESVLIAAQQDVIVAATDTTDNLIVLDGTALVEGQVEDIYAVDADITLSGDTASVERIFTLAGSLTVDEGATIGDLYYSGTELDETAIRASVTGELVNAQEELVGYVAAIAAVIIVLLIFIVIGAFIASLALTLLVIAFGTNQTRRAAATITNDVLKTIVVGLLMLVIPTIVISILFATIVGIPLAIALVLLWGVVLFLGQVVVATWIGERILPRARTAARPYGAAFLGMIILTLLWWTGVVPLLAGIFGTGAVTLAGWRVLRTGGIPPVPPGYGQAYGQPMQVVPPPYAPPPYAPPPVAPPPAPQEQYPPQAPQDQYPPQAPQDQYPPQSGQDQWPPQGGQPPASWPQG